MNKNKKRKSFVSDGEPLFDNKDFIQFFHSRVEQMIRNEVEQHFRDTLYKSEWT